MQIWINLVIFGRNGFHLCICRIWCDLDDMGNFVIIFLHTVCCFPFNFILLFVFLGGVRVFFFNLLYDVHRFEWIGSFLLWFSVLFSLHFFLLFIISIVTFFNFSVYFFSSFFFLSFTPINNKLGWKFSIFFAYISQCL